MGVPLLQSGGGGGGAVSSVFTRTGAVVAASGDYTVAQITGAAPLASPSFTGAFTLPNGVLATTQSALDASTKLATTAYVDAATASLAGPMVSPGGILLPFPDVGAASTFSVAGMGANEGYLFQFRLRTAIKITSARAYQAAGTTAGAKIYFGIYSIAGALLVTIVFTLVGAPGILVGVVSATTVLPEGDYYYVVAIDTTSVADTLVSSTITTNISNMMNGTANRVAFKTGILSAGALATPITPSAWSSTGGFGGTSSLPLIFVNA